ncbi:TSSK4-like protein [Mya arenaria]|uniref:TSSK4-like protein n=1 Tax=Mya arenaria TaxID=6604 RepID=A0ABY7ETY3_MYAAR|nr:TSSK4-like protein [Mya arenaria]
MDERMKTDEHKSGEKSNKSYKILESQGYIVGRTLGSGSYARVKCAYAIHKKHKVAIKIINKKKSFDDFLVKFLPREIEAMRILSKHYALIQFYQIIETTSRYFFIMEYAERGDLLTEVKSRGRIPEVQAGRWFVHMYDGVRYMHRRGIVHRDIKCENLVLDGKNVLKLTDFGFAKKIGRAKSGGPLLSETFCGSYAYAAPEILKGVPYNPVMSDIWSMGVVLYTMLVQSRITLPARPEVSSECKTLMLKIFVRVADRVQLRSFLSDHWFRLHKASSDLEMDDGETENKTSVPAGPEADAPAECAPASGPAPEMVEGADYVSLETDNHD